MEMQEPAIELVQATNPYPNPNLTNRWVWMAFLIRFFHLVIALKFLHGGAIFASLVTVFFALSAIIYVDVWVEQKRSGLDAKKWFVLGILSPTAYALMRAIKVTGRFGPIILLIVFYEFLYLSAIAGSFAGGLR